MNDLSSLLKHALLDQGADLVGFANLRGLSDGRGSESAVCGFPYGVSVAVKYPKAVIRGIAEGPTAEYYEHYGLLNDRLDALAESGAAFLREKGFSALAKTRAAVAWDGRSHRTALPHKTVATLAGLGWIGKSTLLVTPEYGSMIRLTSVLTDAPLDAATPLPPGCGDCAVCAGACPVHAITGLPFTPDRPRETFLDPAACEKAARERSLAGFGVSMSICGKCIEVCPHTRRYLSEPPL